MIESLFSSVARLGLLLRWGEPYDWEDEPDPLCSEPVYGQVPHARGLASFGSPSMGSVDPRPN
jgi:hypothetical protein